MTLENFHPLSSASEEPTVTRNSLCSVFAAEQAFSLKLLFVFALMCAAIPVFAEQTLYVQVRELALKNDKQHWAKSVGSLNYGDKLQLLEKDGAWLYVEGAEGKKGYIHESGVTNKVIVGKGGSKEIPAEISQSEVVLAGKGFNKDIEENYKAQETQHVNYQALEKVDEEKVSPERFENFLKEGKLLSFSDEE